MKNIFSSFIAFLVLLSMLIALNSCSEPEVKPAARTAQPVAKALVITIKSNTNAKFKAVIQYGVDGLQKADTVNTSAWVGGCTIATGQQLNVNVKGDHTVAMQIQVDGQQTAYSLIDGETLKVKF